MAKETRVDAHPNELYVVSAPQLKGLKNLSVWYCTSVREMLFLAAQGLFWRGEQYCQTDEKLVFGEATYFGSAGKIDLSGVLSPFWKEYMFFLAENGAPFQNNWSQDGSGASGPTWEVDTFDVKDLTHLKHVFIAEWTIKIEEHLQS